MAGKKVWTVCVTDVPAAFQLVPQGASVSFIVFYILKTLGGGGDVEGSRSFFL